MEIENHGSRTGLTLRELNPSVALTQVVGLFFYNNQQPRSTKGYVDRPLISALSNVADHI